MNPVSMMRMADMAMVYGRRSASLTRLSIVFLPLVPSVDETMRKMQIDSLRLNRQGAGRRGLCAAGAMR